MTLDDNRVSTYIFDIDIRNGVTEMDRRRPSTASDLASLSAKKLREVIARRDAHWTKTLDATIAAGMGHMRFSEIVEFAKGSSLLPKVQLARDYLNARQDWKVANDEIDARMTYQGNDKPIKRA